MSRKELNHKGERRTGSGVCGHPTVNGIKKVCDNKGARRWRRRHTPMEEIEPADTSACCHKREVNHVTPRHADAAKKLKINVAVLVHHHKKKNKSNKGYAQRLKDSFPGKCVQKKKR